MLHLKVLIFAMRKMFRTLRRIQMLTNYVLRFLCQMKEVFQVSLKKYGLEKWTNSDCGW